MAKARVPFLLKNKRTSVLSAVFKVSVFSVCCVGVKMVNLLDDG